MALLSTSPAPPTGARPATAHETSAGAPDPTLTVPSRRTLLQGIAATGVATGLASMTGAGEAEAASAYAAAASPTRLLSAPDRHLVSRFSYGITPDLADAVRAAGGGRAWFEKQLSPSSIPDAEATDLLTWWPSLRREAGDLWQRHSGEVEGGWQVMENYQRWSLLRRMHSNRQVHEVMTEFWLHHLNVPANGDPAFTHRTDYDLVVRDHALGRFEDLLHAAITHPAMGIYLNNAVSTKSHPNENLGRELLELHTVGRGSYGEDDVKSSARILTGWVVDMWRTFAASYRPDKHWTGPVRVMGFSDPNADADGRDVTRRYLTYLARHPQTARRIARKLAVKFVRDDVPQSLVDRLADVYLSSGTDISAVLRALVSSAEFKGASGAKVRDPGEDVVATYRALGVRLARPPAGRAGRDHAANVVLWQSSSIGLRPFDWPRPDGQPLDNDSWASPSRLMASMEMHYSMAGGWWPKQGVDYRSPTEWFPPTEWVTKRLRVKGRKNKRGKPRKRWKKVRVRRPLRFDRLVDHLSRQMLHEPASARLVQACCEAVDVGPRTTITADHAVVRWNFQRVLTTLLDSPTHLSR